MSKDVTPSQVRERQFDAARRGYDRAEVEEYLGSLADEIERLRSVIEINASKDLAVGLDDPAALALEFDTIGDEISKILEAARAAADGMRRRASSDVAQWRSTAEVETRSLTVAAVEQSQSMRASAWNEGSSMLSSAVAAAEGEIATAKEDALFVRAESEREAIRLTGDAKRDREELIRAARMESEQMLSSARDESDGILTLANRQAEKAQERARSLEDRRAELLSELESTRASIGKLEEEVESRRQVLDTSEPNIGAEPDQRTHHVSDSGSVKIVAHKKTVHLKPVDAEDLVADVVALRSSEEAHAEGDTAHSHVETVAVIAPPVVTVPPPSTPPPLVESPPPVAPSLPAGEPAATTSPEDYDREPSAAPDAEPRRDDLGSLFASLRAEQTSPPQLALVSTRATGSFDRESPKFQESRRESSASGGESPPEEEVAAPVAESIPDTDGGREGDESSSLIPLQNTALREIKRALVNLQNDALELLRTDPGWTPGREFTNHFSEPYADLALGIADSPDDAGAAETFSADLYDAVLGAIEKARESGAGERQTASDVSRVFRMWRADEAERRVVDAAESLASPS